MHCICSAILLKGESIMEIFCSEGNKCIKLKEITIRCTTDEIKKLENFFRITGERHRKFSASDPDDTYHTHYQDWDKEWDGQNDIIIVTPPAERKNLEKGTF